MGKDQGDAEKQAGYEVETEKRKPKWMWRPGSKIKREHLQLFKYALISLRHEVIKDCK